MTQTHKRALSNLVIWGVVAVGFLIVFFGDGGPTNFATDQRRMVPATVLVNAGILAFFVTLYVTRSRRGESRVTVDERDRQIERRAAGGTLIFVLLAVYLACAGLWEAYRGEGCVPVGWLWFLGYATVIFGSLAHAVTILVLYRVVGGDGEG